MTDLGSVKPVKMDANKVEQISLEGFIRHITQTIVENFVMHKDGPLRGLSAEYILSLSKEEVEEMAREDDVTMRRRDELRMDIEQLQRAQAIARGTREQMRSLVAA